MTSLAIVTFPIQCQFILFYNIYIYIFYLLLFISNVSYQFMFIKHSLFLLIFNHNSANIKMFIILIVYQLYTHFIQLNTVIRADPTRAISIARIFSCSSFHITRIIAVLTPDARMFSQHHILTYYNN